MGTPYPLVFVSSLSVLSFEILLVRVFSVKLSYHYASLIISLSMAGLVAGALLAFVRQKRAHLGNNPSNHPCCFIAAILAISYPAIFILLSVIPLDHARMLWDNSQIIYLALFILLCAIPFSLYGLFISLTLSIWRENTSMVYAIDLAGGSTGLFLVFLCMDYLKIDFVMIILAVVVSAVVIFFLKKVFAQILFGFVVFIMCILIGLGVSTLEVSPYKGLMQALKDDDASHVATIYSSHSQLDLFENPRMKFAPGLSLAFTGHVPNGTGMALDGEIVGVIMDGNNSTPLDFLEYLPSSLPYILAQPKDAVIIGAKNSIDTLQARYFGVQDVNVSEHDISVLKALNGNRESHGSLSSPVIRGSGRNLLKTLRQSQGLIFLSKIGFFLSGSFGLQEDYDLTVEAIEMYIKSLHNNGILFMQMFLLPPPRIELRVAKNIDIALKNLSISETRGHLLIYRSWDTINFLVKRNGFSEADFKKAQQFLADRQFDILYPEVEGQERFIIGPDYGGLFKTIIEKVPIDFLPSYIFDIRETTDDRPFFYYFLKLSRINEVYEVSGRKWAYFIHEGMFLPFVLIFLVFLALIIFLFTFLISGTTFKQFKIQDSRFKINYLFFFALIGFAFMFVEIFFIHRLILFFGSPVKAFSMTIMIILLSAGIGSMTSKRITHRASVWIMILAPLFIVASYFMFDRIDETPASVALIIPIGVVMGLFFPTGIRYLTENKDDKVPLAYATNSAASLVAPSLASLLAVTYGCSSLLILATTLYALATAIILTAAYKTQKATQQS